MGNAEICSRLLHFNKSLFETIVEVILFVLFIYNYVKFPFICVVQIKCMNANDVSVCKTSDGENVFAGNNMTFSSTNSILFMSPIKNSDHCYRCIISANNRVV
jgi:hypothetical protein